MNIQTLRLFVAVCEEGSFSAASRRLYITPSAVIQKIQQLESEIGFSLFIRRHSGVSLSDTGKIFYEGTVGILEQLDDTLEACHHILSHEADSLRLGVHTKTMLGAYQAFMQLHPDCGCSYRIFSEKDIDQAFSALLNGSLNILEWSYTPYIEENGLCFLPRYESSLCCVFSPSHSFNRLSDIPLDMLSDQNFYIYSHNQQNTIEYALTQALSAHSVSCDRPLKSINGDPNAILELCRSNGIVLVSESYAKELPFPYRPIKPFIPISFGLAYRRTSGKATKLFLDFLKKYDAIHGVIY